MKVVAGCIIKKDNKILMIKENKSEFHGKWNYPAGKVEEFEKITEAAMREAFEETGCKVKLKGVLPIANADLEKETHVIIHFLAEMVEECNSFDKEEIMEAKWIDIEDIKKMKKEELRGYELNTKVIEDIENDRIYPLALFDNNTYGP